MTSPSPLLSRPGAVAGDGPEAGAAIHYGDPMREQRLLAAGEGLVDLSHMEVVTVTGPDRLRWLDSMTTQRLLDVTPGTSTESLVLSPHGHVEHSLHVLDDGETTFLLVEPGEAHDLLAFLDRMRFMLQVDVQDATAQWALVGEPTDASGERAWVDPWPRLGPDTAAYGPVEGHPGLGWRWREVLVPRADLAEHVGDRPLAGLWAYDALRIAAWRPRLGHETDHRTIPHEVDWLRTAVHLHKGCYRGQETVARVHNLGRPPRRLAFVHLDGSGHVLPAAGADVVVEDGGRAIGRLTSVARHHELGPIGLVVVKRSVPVDVPLLVDGIAATQEEIVAR